MNLVTHILKKDLRHLRGLLAVWGVLVVIQIGLGGSGLAASADNMAWEITFSIVSFVIPMLQFLLVLAIVPLLIHDEPLVGTTAFWFTRPIARTDLLKSKSLFCIGLLVLIPLIIELVVLAMNQAALAQLGLAIPEIIIDRLSYLLMIAALAVLTPNFARFVLWAVILYVCFMIVFFVIYIFNLFVDFTTMYSQFSNPTLVESRGIAASLIGIVGCSAVVLNQYLTRKTRRSICMLATVLVLYMSVSQMWPWDFMKREVIIHQTADYDESSINLRLLGRDLSVSDVFRMNSRKDLKKNINGNLKISGGAPGFEFRSRVAESSLTFESGFVAEKDPDEFTFPQRVWDHDAVSHALGEYTVLNRDEQPFPLATLGTIDDLRYLEVTEQSADLKATVDIEVYQYVITGAIPLKKKERIDLGVEQAVITDILENPVGCSVILRERTLNLKFDNVATQNPFNPRDQGDVLYLLRNPREQECIMPGGDFTGNMTMMMNKAQRLKVDSVRLEFGGENAHFGRIRGRLDKEWLNHAELVRLEAVKVGHFTKNMEEKALRFSRHPYPTSVQETKSQEDIENALSAITLPETPTQEEVRNYIRDIDHATEGQRRWRPKDRQVSMLKKIGSEHVPLLFQEYNHSYHLRFVIPSLINDSHKSLVISKLPDHPWLAKTVWEKNWTESARDILIEGLRDNPDQIDFHWFKAVASFGDAATHKDLVAYFVNRDHSEASYRILKQINGIDLVDAVTRAWKSAKYGYDHEVSGMIPIALNHGLQDALRLSITDYLEDPAQNNAAKKRVRQAVKKYTGLDMSDYEFVAWFKQNQDQLVFDPDKKIFHTKSN